MPRRRSPTARSRRWRRDMGASSSLLLVPAAPNGAGKGLSVAARTALSGHSMLNAAPRAGPEHPAPGVSPVTWAAVEPDRQADIAALDSTLTTVERVLDVDGLRSRIQKLEHEPSNPKWWDDRSNAQRVTSQLSHAQGELRRIEELRQRLDDLPVLSELAAEEGGSDELAEADAELKALRADIEAAEVRTLLSG